MTTDDYLILCLIRHYNACGERHVTTAISGALDIPRNTVLKGITNLYHRGLVKRLNSPLLTMTGHKVANGHYLLFSNQIEVYEIARKL